MEEQNEGIFLKPPEHSAADAMDAAREKRLMEADAPPELKTSYFDRMMSSLRRRIK
jgi:hypothetical protein